MPNCMGLSCVRLNNKLIKGQTVNRKATLLTALMILVVASPMATPVSADEIEEITEIGEKVNPVMVMTKIMSISLEPIWVLLSQHHGMI